MHITSLRRAATVVAVGALALPVVATAPAAASPEPQPGAAATATSWLATQLTDGVIHNSAWDFDDLGMTLDIGLSMDEVGGDRAMVRQIRATMDDRIAEYVTGGSYGDPEFRLAGELAKSLVFAQVSGADPGTYGGFDLVDEVEQRVITSGPSAGRIENLSPAAGWDDYANVFSQALAVRGLAVAGSPKAPATADFLMRQQCASGYFRVFFTVDKSAAQQGCEEGAPGSGADTDATAVAVSALARISPRPASVQASIDRATAWLTTAQRSDGSFSGSAVTADPNSNSTGLAAAALATAGQCRAAGRAAEWVSGVQVGPQPAGSPLAGEEGAIAYAPADLETARASGIGGARDVWWRATVQAVAGAAHRLGSTHGLTVLASRDGDGSVTLRGTGLVAGERYCLSGPGIDGTRSLRVAGDGVLSTSVPAPAIDGQRWTLTGRDGRVEVDAGGTATALSPIGGARVLAPRGYQRAGTRIALEVAGAREGDRFAIDGGGLAGTRVVVGSEGSAARMVTLPATTGVVRYSLLGSNGSTSVDVRVLGRARLRVKVQGPSAAVKRRVVVTRLAPRERVSLAVGKRIVWQGRADARGRVVRRLALPASTVRVRAVGQYAGRVGSAKVRGRS